MSQENVGVRTLVTAAPAPTRRTLDERVFVRFPALVRVLLFVYARLSPGSRLCQAFTARSLSRFAAAFNRRDFDLLLVFLDPEITFEGAECLVGGYFPDLPRSATGASNIDACARR